MKNPFESIDQRFEQVFDLLEEIKTSLNKKETLELGMPEHLRLSRKEVCSIYKISLAKLHGLMKEGKIPFTKVGRRTLFRSVDIEDFFDKGTN